MRLVSMYNLEQLISETSAAGLIVALAILWIFARMVAGDNRAAMLGSKAIGGLAFLAYFASASSGYSQDNLTATILRGLVFGGLVACASAIALAAVFLAWTNVLHPAQKTAKRLPGAGANAVSGVWRFATRGKRRREELARAAKQAEIDAAQRIVDTQRRLEREQEEHRQRLERERDHQRRLTARSDAELLYRRYGVEMKGRFTKKMLDDYMAKYMGDEQPASEVERRGQQLQTIVRHHQEAVEPPVRTLTVERLMEWYDGENKKIEGLLLDDEWKDELQIGLKRRFSEFMKELLKQAQP